jgi:hypothetical protein
MKAKTRKNIIKPGMKKAGSATVPGSSHYFNGLHATINYQSGARREILHQ